MDIFEIILALLLGLSSTKEMTVELGIQTMSICY